MPRHYGPRHTILTVHIKDLFWINHSFLNEKRYISNITCIAARNFAYISEHGVNALSVA